MIRVAYKPTPEEVRTGFTLLLSRSPHATPRAAWRGAIGWLVFGGLAVVLFMLQQRTPAPMPAGATPVAGDEAGSIGWALPAGMAMLGVGLALFAVAWRLVVRGAAQPMYSERDDVVATIDESGIVIERPNKRTEYRWSRFSTFIETETLFMLRAGPSNGLVLPKRMFASEESVAEVRALLHAHALPKLQTLQQGFDLAVPP